METSGWSESSKGASSIRASLHEIWMSWTVYFQMMLQDPLGLMPSALPFPFAVCPPFLFPVSSLFLPYFHFCFALLFSLEVSPFEWFGVFYKNEFWEGKKSKFWETSCHPWICTNQHKCVCWSPRGLTIPCTALWGLAKRTILCECNMFPSFPSFCDLKETGKNQRTKVMQCSPPKTAMELGFENPCSCIWVSNSASSAGQRVPGLPPVY